MVHAQLDPTGREALAAQAVTAKTLKNLSWQQIADASGLSVAYTTAAVLGQHPLPETSAKAVAGLLGLDSSHRHQHRAPQPSPTNREGTPLPDCRPPSRATSTGAGSPGQNPGAPWAPDLGNFKIPDRVKLAAVNTMNWSVGG
ncbi:hypothetical protein ACFVS7_27750 [Streptomyces rubiginosohelvolus]|uniref:hypothetical protein n=1 Tax=Streptomyces rubiginosohelvolus TaxID=67362 RepID=UPI0036DF6220